MEWTCNVPARSLIWIPMLDGSEVVIDAVDVVSIKAIKKPGGQRHVPGGVTMQDPASYDVTFRFRSGSTDSVNLCAEAWIEVSNAIKKVMF